MITKTKSVQTPIFKNTFDDQNVFFEAENFKLFQGDSFQILKTLEPRSVNMIFADPPYFLSNNGISCHSGKQVVNHKGKWDETKTIEEKLEFNREWLRLCREVLTDDGTIWISGTYHNIYTVGVALELEGYSIINNITWQKPNPTPNLAGRSFTNSTETIIWARKQLTAKTKGKHFYNYALMKEINGGKQMKDVWLLNLPTPSEKKFGKHPTQKPLSVLERLILASTKENDLVLDCFNGSGTTGIAANKLNRKYIGIDSELEYLELTKNRFLDLKKNLI
ncbi:DNA-methyltransferase [Mycoplasmopsis agassizii]|uniref:Methyltransferase n=1 Tax=Mycoplasmopsis agassizii TaxID=33922 RepID=A0ABX4H429_9BACT|nr:site-specific DNA-methyltransferase [Mycoplasmopsis agassizii]PAF54645.1 site-specific DNA-methyltransferase [Mycoplasmopsis agassizii]SMC16187.1 site-specific DNA-methyltransferase (adenine-specific) [Mycoplasmopsis agassizii]